jgi:D-cysteine desulfhydrase
MTALFEVFPALRARVPWLELGTLPTRLELAPAVLRAAGVAGELWLKRDDASSAVYGGNKLRLLEHLLGQAKAQGATHVYSSGARGSNFAVATALHAPRVGLVPGAICFPQPLTAEGEASHRIVQARSRLVEIAHWSLLPLATERVKRRQGERAHVLSQVRVGPEGLLGYVAGGLELALDVQAGACPPPWCIVLPIGSAATTAGLLAGLGVANKLGLWPGPLPVVAAVRVAAWPLSRRARVWALAREVLAFLASQAHKPELSLSARDLPQLTLVTDQLGAGYPEPTSAGQHARRIFQEAGYPILDDTYSAKAAAHLLTLAAGAAGPLLFWSTKSSSPLPDSPPGGDAGMGEGRSGAALHDPG